MFRIIKNKRGKATLIEFLVAVAIIAIFTALLIPIIDGLRKKAAASRAKPESVQAVPESMGKTITLEWKQGMRATPETIEIVEGVSGITVNDCNDLVLALSGGSHRIIPKEKLPF
ncbi:hypothetical protein HYT92_03185 [Candidatus Pacearchaeota archaeon]|nr:hypothetical protein [Candidatus Pacearchaeota archaeon]